MAALIIAIAILFLVSGWIVFGDRLKPGEPANETEKRAQGLEISLDELRDRGVNIDGPILWNYLFVSRDYPQLGRFMEHMRKSGYEVAEVNEVDDGDTGLVDYELRLQIREQHTAQSLSRKIEEMRDLAAKFQLDLFDGWYPEGYVERRPEEMEH
jgi:regulator of RNase E activity RraB